MKTRDPNEPSIHDHNAPYNEEEYIDANGEEQVRCGCSSCRKQRHDQGYDDYDYLIERAIEKAEFQRDEAMEWMEITETGGRRL